MKFLPLHIFETWKAPHKAITGNALACKQVLWGALAAGQKRKRACMCQECLKPDCKLSLFFGPLTECPWELARRLGVPLPQEQSSAVSPIWCLLLMSINFKRKNKNWTKDQWNWHDSHGWTAWHLPYQCCWEVDGHNTSHYHHKSSHWNVKQ